jgi:hypothetical protein
MSWVGGYTSKNVGEPSLRIDAVHFGGDDKAVHPLRAARRDQSRRTIRPFG